MKVTLIQETPNPVETIANIAGICYGKDKAKNPKKLVENLLRLKHLSVFEHVYFTWKIEGISRTCLAQLTRHRIASYSVKSQRYVKENQFEYIIPHAIENIPEAKEIFMKTMENNQIAYNKLVDLLLLEQIKDFWRCEGVHEEELIKYEDSLLEDFKERYRKGYNKLEKQVIEDARFILPQALETELYMSCNLRELLHIYKLRSHKSAQWEIRELVEKIRESVNPELDFMFEMVLND